MDKRTPLIDDFSFGMRIFFRRGFLGFLGLRARANFGTAKPRASNLDVSAGTIYHRLLVLLLVVLLWVLLVVALLLFLSFVARLRLVLVAAFLFVVLARFVALLRLRAGSPASSGIAGGNMPVGMMPPSMSNGKPPGMPIGGIGGVGGTCACLRRGIIVHLFLRFLDAFFARFLAPALPKPCLPYAMAAAILRACSKLRGRYVAREVVILPVLLYSRRSFWISFDASVAFLFALPLRLFVLRGILITFLCAFGFYACTMPL